MSFERSYGKIKEQNKMLGLNMVNPESKEFFIYAKYLKDLYVLHNQFYIVKKRDREYKKDRGYHQGEVIGILFKQDENFSDKDLVTTIELYFGPGEQSLKLSDDEAEVLNWVEWHSYSFPQDEFRSFMNAIIAMEEQHKDYMNLKMNARLLMKRNPSLL